MKQEILQELSVMKQCALVSENQYSGIVAHLETMDVNDPNNGFTELTIREATDLLIDTIN